MSPSVESIDVGWGPNGLRDLSARCDIVIVVDVLRFTTAVDAAAGRGAHVYPYKWHDGTEAAFARDLDAELAVRNVIHGRPVKNVDALANPEALEHFRNLPDLATD